MKNAAPIPWAGRNEVVGDWLVNRLIPNEQFQNIGGFVHLGHLYPSRGPLPGTGSGAGRYAHPHRGIVTLCYLFDGGLEHRDSRGNSGIAHPGDVLWLKAGNGIVHEEKPQLDGAGEKLHALQFWFNLPAANKAEEPEFLLLRSEDIPELDLPGVGGKLRIILGNCGGIESPVPAFGDEFIFHVHLHPKSELVYKFRNRPEYGVFVPHHPVKVNGEAVSNSHLLAFFDGADDIRLYNPGIYGADVILFGGAEWKETFVAEGPFVMNSRKEIAGAYRDFFEGRYGELPNDPAA